MGLRARDNLPMELDPSLEFVEADGLPVLTDRGARGAGISVTFTTRVGGVSSGAFESLNLSDGVGDDPAAVETNRATAAAAAGVPAGALTFGRQVHGTNVIDCDAVTGTVEGDAFVTRSRNQAVGALAADCVPVLVLAADGVAAIHAGWRGIVAGVVPTALSRLTDPIAAWVGPAIRACCYEVGPDVTSAFEEQALPIADPWHVEPAAAVAAQLRRAGIERIAASQICTSCDTRFFSHRRDRVTGRQGGFIALL